MEIRLYHYYNTKTIEIMKFMITITIKNIERIKIKVEKIINNDELLLYIKHYKMREKIMISINIEKLIRKK